MKYIELKKIEHDKKVGDDCLDLKPNISEDTIFTENNIPIGFFIKNMGDYSEKANLLANLADKELRSDNVPKTMMRRSSDLKAKREGGKGVKQFSVIIGSVPPKPFMRRAYPTRSSVHQVKSAQTFIKAMLLLCMESEKIIQKITPDIYDKQKDIFDNQVIPKWKFGNLFTSSISNFNIPAGYHIDKANIKDTVNVIITKRAKSTGGNLNLPDYDATIDQVDNSMLVYPAWKNMHGVTPINQLSEDGYRNSLVFYPLRAFMK